jgi:RHH-type proline utilization regulon transcriptional repressor/proline dehydrogenase/delta 1-pyrroline-5-carboxylate dehydrogenase
LSRRRPEAARRSTVRSASVRGPMRKSLRPCRAARRFSAGARRPRLERAADLLEQRGALHRAVANEGGKTLDDALSEVREAVDFCRYYAAEGRKAVRLGPQIHAGTDRREQCAALCAAAACSSRSAVEFSAGDLHRPSRGGADGGQQRGGKAGRTDAADRGGAPRLLHEAGVPRTRAASGARRRRGRRGAGRPSRIAGVVFTGSTEVARIDQSGAGRQRRPDRAADRRDRRHQCHDRRCHRACPSRSTDDVVTSAFRSAGQRCSALRLLFVQDDVADRMIEMIAGAARELAIGDPAIPQPISGR